MFPLRLAIVALAALGLGCNITPAHLEEIDSPQQPVSFWGYTITPNREIRVECGYGGEWNELATFWSSSSGTPDNPGSSSMVYRYEHSVQIPDECWGPGRYVVTPEHPPPGVLTHWGATVRVLDVVSGQEHESFTESGQACLVSTYAATRSFIETYEACATPTISDVIRLYARVAPDPPSP